MSLYEADQFDKKVLVGNVIFYILFIAALGLSQRVHPHPSKKDIPEINEQLRYWKASGNRNTWCRTYRHYTPLGRIDFKMQELEEGRVLGVYKALICDREMLE